MDRADCLYFGPFCLDTHQLCLWHDERRMAMRRQTMTVLLYLASRPRQVIAKEELLQNLWHRATVSRSALRVCIREIRSALGERADNPQYIETVGYKGYRFCAEVRDTRQTSAYETSPYITRVFGRQREMALLQQALHDAQQGTRQMVLMRAEMGLGKTALAETFLSQCEAAGHQQIARGQCIQNRAAEVPYLPLFDILEQLCSKAQGDAVRRVLHQYAPMCQIVLPGLGGPATVDPPRNWPPNGIDGVTQTQLFLELARALEALSASAPLILLLEDLHECDDATMTFFSFLMQRRDAVRLLVLGTYRSEVVFWQSPLSRERLQAMQNLRLCHTLGLDRLSRDDTIGLAEACLGGEVTGDLGTWLFDRTAGHPLHLKHSLSDLQQRDWLRQRNGRWSLQPEANAAPLSIPPSLRHQIMRQYQSLTPDMQQILKAASVAGTVFEAVTLAAPLQMAQDVVERSCQAIADTTFLLETVGMAHWRDATVSGRYRFRYEVYRQVIEEGLSAWEWTQLLVRLKPGESWARRRQADGLWKSGHPFA